MAQSKKHAILKKLYELNLEVNNCKYCQGTGLAGVTSWINDVGILDHSWDGTYCDRCNGLGFHLPDKDFVLYFCSKCNGDGRTGYEICSSCGGEGIVYWIDHLRGKQNVGNL